MRVLCCLLVLLSASHAAVAGKKKDRPFGWTISRVSVETDASLRGLYAVDSKVVWASGVGGVYLRTIDGGSTWEVKKVPGAEELDFRDVRAFSADTAYLLAAGPGEKSCIYKTVDGGANWTRQHINPAGIGFLDGFAFWSPEKGIAYGDPVDGRFQVLITEDGGTWKPIDPNNIPPALEGEAGFAASGSGIAVHESGLVWFGTGGGPKARVFRSVDWGKTWAAVDTPITSGTPSKGIFTVAFADSVNGVALGGDYQQPKDRSGVNGVYTTDGGMTWQEAKGLTGFRSGAAMIANPKWKGMMAVGSDSMDVTFDNGANWSRASTSGFNSIRFAPDGTHGWVVGANGSVGRIKINPNLSRRLPGQ